ncbi:MAG: NUDIX hydrolase, partial [Saprospiraceae bacterium]|nr:NUDIX hydrolase [Saprospiraceae bacterium]
IFKNLAVGIVPLDEDYNTWLVGQYRYVLNDYSWEIPEGGCPLDAEPLLAAQRELQEETGITAQKWTKLLDMHISNSVTDEFGQVFIAQTLSFGIAMPEDTEDLQVKKISFQQAFDAVMSNEITDSLSIAAIMKTMWWIEKGWI